MRIKSHGIEFIRSGECKQCGACGCKKCVHGLMSLGLSQCTIYESREERCAACSWEAGEDITHANCLKFPDNPWIHVVRQGICGFTFERADGGLMDNLPFLNDEPYHGNHNA